MWPQILADVTSDDIRRFGIPIGVISAIVIVLLVQRSQLSRNFQAGQSAGKEFRQRHPAAKYIDLIVGILFAIGFLYWWFFSP